MADFVSPVLWRDFVSRFTKGIVLEADEAIGGGGGAERLKKQTGGDESRGDESSRRTSHHPGLTEEQCQEGATNSNTIFDKMVTMDDSNCSTGMPTIDC